MLALARLQDKTTVTLSDAKAVGPQVYQILRHRIISGDLLPGARLSETEIASAYEISRQPVREAFIRLTGENLVTVRPQRGTFVTRISVPSVLAARFIREAAEVDIVRLVARDITTADLDPVMANLADQKAAMERKDGAEFVALDDMFHRLLADISGQLAAWDFLDGLKSQMNRVRHIAVYHGSPDRIIAQHDAIVTALRHRDADGAETAMREHLREVLTDLPNIAQALPDYFELEEVET